MINFTFFQLCARVGRRLAFVSGVAVTLPLLAWLMLGPQHVAATTQNALQAGQTTVGTAQSQRSHAPMTTLLTTLATTPPLTQPHSLLTQVTANDIFLPGTQPGGLISALADSTSCTFCHVNHIVTEYAGSMMANSARDPLFRAALQVANQDVPGAGEFCIRCHSPNAWLNGRASGDGANGSKLNAMDLQGISCTTCHRLVPPTPFAGESPRDAVERDHILGTVGATMRGSGAYILDREEYRRGAYQVFPPHATTQTSYTRSAELCATCHDIDNPLLSFDTANGEFRLNAPNTPAPLTDRLFPVERTYSEWAASDFANGGVTGLDYPGLRRATGTESGPITVCQDCHMPMVKSILGLGGIEREVGKHQWAGGNSRWQKGIWQLWKDVAADTSFNADQTLAATAKGEAMLRRAAELELAIVNNRLQVSVINNTGHKLPTGYAEGRRMWLQVIAYSGTTPIYQNGVPVDGAIGRGVKIYEVKQGITPGHAQDLGQPTLAGAGFHFILNNATMLDNRIPPRGFTNAAFVADGMQPIGYGYADGQYWDTTTYQIPPATTTVSVTLLYQTASPDYLDFLEANADVVVADAVLGEMNWGQTLGQLRRDLDLTAPAIMASAAITPTFDPNIPFYQLYLPVVTQ